MKSRLRQKKTKTIQIKINDKGKYLQNGARLSKITQKTAYDLILNKSIEKPGGPNTWRRIEEIKQNLENKWNIKTEEEKIWKEISKINNKQIEDFIWKMIHNRIKCGKFFQHIPNWQEKQFCMCGEVESIEHILLKCKESKQGKVWKEVRKIWKKITSLKWKKLSIQDIMGIGSIRLNKAKNKNKELMTEVMKTLVTTAVWSIWKNRNEWIFNNVKETEVRQIGTWKESL